MKNRFEFNSRLLKKLEYSKYTYYDTTIYGVSTLKKPRNNTLIFADVLNSCDVENLKCVKNSILILNKDYCEIDLKENYVIYVNRPRKEYAKILKFILDNEININEAYSFKDGYFVGRNVVIKKNTVIEPFVFIDSNCIIGKNCIIKSGAKIRSNTVIEDNCIIKENSVIGSDGFGVERDSDGTTYKIPHLGGVKIGKFVEVGALSVIAQGTIEPTVIQDYVKIDDCAFIAHNSKIGRGTFVIANSEISGSVEIGENCWISPNVCIKDGVKIGNNSVLGMGAVVLEDIKENSVVIGNPAKFLKNRDSLT
ncbi:UDP-3-O-(3-hydroxymyristoyl)glucosamine N-acyltransferase [Clostridium botulinum]|uniref:UDP-3-O-(3-hydroxymyristoyl)glucosamine N-acyltransferase n=1 Tax=Clostridium botulinum TaxID=1491 RepID=UPI00196729D2|nr:UDP-3-O-(3-hydroxymyristoyl)glucosamine N-acyltransferase [Clostridium botulinum]MBN1064031.1 UDP-3-O-(3-hydroxymyristoyl)glucosamine N-acyltransferase [Clostridium botulinum]